jgi:dihydropteroate synthase
MSVESGFRMRLKPELPRALPRIMGVVNATPDSFSDGGRFLDPAAAVTHALTLAEQGAGILDIGGESTRPGASDVPAAEEIDRTVPVIEGIRKAGCAAQISIDTRKPEVARAAVAAGATIWNDVTALSYAPDSLETAAALSCDIVLMHAQGDPKTMQKNPHYDDVVEEVYAWLAARIEASVNAGLDEARIIVDPGIGFGKTLDNNLALLASLSRFTGLGRPLLLGASRKRFIAALDRDAPADERLGGSLAAVLAGLRQGVSIFRVHDVAATRQALTVAGAIEQGK